MPGPVGSNHAGGPNLASGSRTAATLQDLISSTIAILKEAKDHYDAIENDTAVLVAFHGAGRRLPLVEQALDAVNTQLAEGNLTGDPENTGKILEACKNDAELSEIIFKAVAEAPPNSRFDYYKTAVKEKGQGRMVEALVIAMMKGVCVLAENDSIKEAMSVQVRDLDDAIRELSEMGTSVPTEGSGGIFNQFGSGDQFNAPGGWATKNNLTGSNFSGNVSF